MEKEIKVFISYSHRDTEHARKLHKTLKDVPGVKPWLDDEDLLPGQNWEIMITKAIRESRYFIALLSTRSVSKTGFFHSELKTALEILKRYPEDKIFLIPVRIDDCELPETIGHIHCTEIFTSYERGVKKILRVIKDVKNSVIKSDLIETGKPTEVKAETEIRKEAKPKVPDKEVKRDGQFITYNNGSADLFPHFKAEPKRDLFQDLFQDLFLKPRFINYDNGTVLDTKTGRMWASKDNGKDINWYGAKEYCESYRGGGYDDWRMPTLDELSGLYDTGIRLGKGPVGISRYLVWASETKGKVGASFNFLVGDRRWNDPRNDYYGRALPVCNGTFETFDP